MLSSPPRRPSSARYQSLALLLVISILLAIFPFPVRFASIMPTAEAATTDLFFSEYIEGNSNNKALEIYNGTGAPVDLSAGGYKIEMYFNGATTASTFLLTGTVASNDVFVFAHGAANAAIQAVADQKSLATAAFYNGDDAVVLKKGNVILDVIGQVGFDPGAEWGSGLNSTADNTIRRNSAVCAGDTNQSDAFNPASEWTGFATDDSTGLGSHSATCDSGTPTPTPTPTPNHGALQFSAATYTVSETGSTASITVNRTGGSDGSVTVGYATSNGTATSGAGLDYTAASGTLTFAAGETTKSFSVQILDDAVYEGDETVNLALTSPTGGATLGTQSTATLTITDNETPPVVVPPGSVVISQVYGGGGNAGAFYRYDFIEIFNRSANPVDLTGWSVQYASAGGGAAATWTRRTPLSGTIQPGQYFLIREASGANTNAADLPTPDIIGTIAMGGTDGKVALVRNNVDLPNGCPIGNPNVIDFVGYGTADCFEGLSAAPQLSNATAALRARGGCKDTDYNGANFTEVNPAPRNSSSSFNFCPAGDEAPEVFSTTPANGGTNVPLSSNITINLDEPVATTGNWFQISCTTSGIHTATVTGGTSSFTLNPDTDFVGNEQCTVTVYANQVTDLDANDPPDTMAADYVFSFGTLVLRDPAEHMVMGNPSGAVTDVNTPLNYLMMKTQYALSYNNDKGTSNWTSWHLDSTWVTGVTDRQNDFRSDDTLPPSFKHVSNGYQFAVYGFDRGHMTPSADRTSSIADNSATFLMTNMIPQASGNNQGPWNEMEGYIRTQLSGSQNEIYIVSGGTGMGGNSANGHFDTITDTAGNSVTVPQWTWKVVMVMPNANGNDVARVNNSTRTFAVIMPNNDNIREEDWRKYLATVDQVEALSGYDFFSNVPDEIEAVIEARLDEVNNTAPVANNQSVTTAEDTPKAITLTSSDFNVNNVPTYIVASNPSHGVLSGTGNSLTYTPDGDYSGPDSFTFKVNDGGTDSNTATVSINVTEVNDAPVANNDDKTASEDTALTFPASDLAGNDTTGAANEGGQTLTVSNVIATGNTHGTVSLDGGQVTYTPAANYNGPASFDYTVCDNGTTNGAANSQCATGTVNVTVSTTNDNPVAVNDTASTDEDTAVTINVTANDNDLDGDGLSPESAGNGAHGTTAIVGNDVVYTPAANYNGSDSFTYTVSDGQGGTASATVAVTINPVNDAPTANSQSVNASEDTPQSITLSGNDVETATGNLSYTITAFPVHGTLTGTAPNLTYVPEANYNGPDSFQFTVTDTGDGTSPAITSGPATVSITVAAGNDAPVANAGTDQTVECTGAVTLNGTQSFDPDGDTPLTFEWREGTTVLGTGATLSVTLGYGLHTITLKVTDPSGAYGEDTVNVNVIDTTAPVITPNGQTISLWPANKKLYTISVADLVQSASDSCDASVNLGSVVIASVTSDEGSAADGDIVIGGDCKSVQLRADRNGSSDGRVYTITFRVRDTAGNTTTLTRQVTVPHNQGNSNAVNSGVAYAVTSGCP
jgi:DNA/RNA endonuclease G (NUC1)